MSVSVLMYHHVLPKRGFIASSVDEFKQQMNFLAKNGYTTLSSNEFLLYKKGKLKVPKKSVLITFDDGWRDNFFYAYPILKEFGLKATIFLVTDWIQSATEQNARQRCDFTPLNHTEAKANAPINPGGLFLNWSEIEQMKSNGIDFHSHTHGHTDNYFKKLDFDDEIGLCKQTIKQKLGFDDIHLCWPRGEFNEEKLQIAKKAGYEIFYTTKRGINTPNKNLDSIKRIAVKNDQKWLSKTLYIYQNDILGFLYSKLKG